MVANSRQLTKLSGVPALKLKWKKSRLSERVSRSCSVEAAGLWRDCRLWPDSRCRIPSVFLLPAHWKSAMLPTGVEGCVLTQYWGPIAFVLRSNKAGSYTPFLVFTYCSWLEWDPAYTLGIHDTDPWCHLPVKNIFLTSLNLEEIAIQIPWPSVLVEFKVILQKKYTSSILVQHRTQVLLQKCSTWRHSEVSRGVAVLASWQLGAHSGAGHFVPPTTVLGLCHHPCFHCCFQ